MLRAVAATARFFAAGFFAAVLRAAGFLAAERFIVLRADAATARFFAVGFFAAVLRVAGFLAGERFTAVREDAATVRDLERVDVFFSPLDPVDLRLVLVFIIFVIFIFSACSNQPKVIPFRRLSFKV